MALPARRMGIRRIQDLFRENEHRLYHWAANRGVPRFIKCADPEEEMQLFVEPYGLYWFCLEVDRHDNPREIPSDYHLIEGISPRTLPRVVVGFHGETVHDPHPSALGLSEVECYRILCALDPAKLLRTR